eukprot:8835971-Alexandrium_andersonii.AAC.1
MHVLQNDELHGGVIVDPLHDPLNDGPSAQGARRDGSAVVNAAAAGVQRGSVCARESAKHPVATNQL